MEEIISNLIKRCYEYKSNGSTEKAIECLERILALEPSNGNFWKSLGDLFPQSDSIRSLKSYNNAIVCHNDVPSYRAELAAILVDKNLISDALKAINIAIKIEPNPEYYNLRSCIFMEKNLSDLAIKDLEKAIEIDSADPLFHANLGTVYKEIGDKTNALISFYRAIEINLKIAGTNKQLSLNEIHGLNLMIKELLES